MNKQLLKIYLLAAIVAIAGCSKEEKAAQPESEPMESAPATEQAAPQEQPSIQEDSFQTLEATVTAVNPDTREVTLENADGESATFVAGDEVRNFDQVAVGDKLTIKYMERVQIQVMGADDAEVGAKNIVSGERAEEGAKPGGGAVSQTTIVVEVEAIDKEMGTVTVKGPAGNSKTVKARDPANLDKVAVGDKIKVTYTESLAISVTEQ
jgi:hypothetical protein